MPNNTKVMVQYCGSIYSPIFVSRSQIKALSVFFSNSLHADREKMKEESCLQKKVHILLYSTAELNKLYTSLVFGLLLHCMWLHVCACETETEPRTLENKERKFSIFLSCILIIIHIFHSFHFLVVCQTTHVRSSDSYLNRDYISIIMVRLRWHYIIGMLEGVSVLIMPAHNWMAELQRWK